MYYIVYKKKEGTYLLDKSQDIIWEGPDKLGNYTGDGKDHAWCMWNNVKSSFAHSGNLYFLSAEYNSRVKQFLTVLDQY